MKRIIIALVFVCSLCGCSKEVVNTSSQVSPSPHVKEIKKTEVSYENNMNKYEGCSYDFDSDGDEEEVLLLTDAKKDETGEYMWDDSHHWQLVVNTTDGGYTLYDEYVHGMLELNLSEYYSEDGNTHPIVRLSISTGASFTIKEYRFDYNVFKETTAYDTGYINELLIEKY